MTSIAVTQFLNLQEDKVDNDMEIVVNKIVKAYSISNQIYETDKDDVIILNVRYIKAI